MTKNPFYNASAALVYIVFVASVIYFLGKVASDQPDNNFLIPIAMLSLLVLSASIMSFIFFYRPVTMLIAGEQKQAVQLFLKTVAVFASFTAIAFATMFFLVLF